MGKVKPSTGFEIEDIPHAMTEARRWVNWRAVQRDGNWTKVPVDPNSGDNASSTNPDTWGSFGDAVDAATADSALGIGFMLGDGWLGVDFDGLDQNSTLSAWVWDWGNDSTTYLERSPSGTGVHAIFKGTRLPDWSANRRGPVEVYEKARFFCVTGNRLYSGRDCTADQASVDQVCHAFLDTRSFPHATPAAVGSPGVVSGQDNSAADWALCCDLAKKGLRQHEIETLLRHKMEAEGREEKAARRDYVPRTVAGAIEAAGAPEAIVEPLAIRPLATVIEENPIKTPYMIHKLLRRGEVAAVIAPPKCRKSFLIADLAISGAAGRDWFGQYRVQQGRVLLVDNELSPNEIADRTRTIMGDYGVTMEELGGRLDVLCLRDSDAEIDQVIRQLQALEQPYDLIIFDALYMFLEKGMDENSNADMTCLLRKFRRLASRTGAAVILVHHTSKGVQAGKEAIDLGAGAGALGRAVDTNIAIFRHEEDNCFVMKFNVRSSEPKGDLGIQWSYPTFRTAHGIDLEELYTGKKAKKAE